MNNSITHVVPERRFLKFQQIRKFIGEAATPNFQTKRKSQIMLRKIPLILVPSLGLFDLVILENKIEM
jgi:hypothetical protein